MDDLRVCLVSAEFQPMQGGVGDFTRELGLALMDLGAEVQVVTSTQAGELPGSGLSVRPMVPSWGWGCWRKVLAATEERGADIINIQYQTAAYGMHPAINFLPLWLRLRGRGMRTMTTFHDLRLPYLFPKAGGVRRWVTAAVIRWSDAVIVTNREDEQILATYGGHRHQALIPIGSNIAPQPPQDYYRDAWRSRLGIGPDDTLLSYFGFLNESKGGEALIRVVARLRELGHPVKLLMVGGKVGTSDPTNVAYAEKVERLIAELGLSEAVLRTGFTAPEEVSANLMASDVCLLPYLDGASFRRGSFMAALAHGLPIVSTLPAVETPELRQGENILLAPPDEVEALAQRVLTLMADQDLRRRLGEGARHLSRRFEWDRIARETLTLYRDISSS
jgi:glycosyltransferase involved in cell wall biosynthesis